MINCKQNSVQDVCDTTNIILIIIDGYKIIIHLNFITVTLINAVHMD